MTRKRRRILVIPLSGNEEPGHEIADRHSGEVAVPTLCRFPDDETYVRLDACVDDSDVVLVATLDLPNSSFAGDGYRHLSSAGVEEIVTTDTIRHETNAIGVGHALADAVAELVG